MNRFMCAKFTDKHFVQAMEVGQLQHGCTEKCIQRNANKIAKFLLRYIRTCLIYIFRGKDLRCQVVVNVRNNRVRCGIVAYRRMQQELIVPTESSRHTVSCFLQGSYIPTINNNFYKYDLSIATYDSCTMVLSQNSYKSIVFQFCSVLQ